MLLIGDVHGLFWDYKRIIKSLGVKRTLQLGDFGLGFLQTMDFPDMSGIEGEHLFIRRNHDNPAVCRADKHCVGDFGVLEGSFIDGLYDKLFFIAGAWSIDEAYRTPGISWWEDEQLSHEQLADAIDKYSEVKPDIVCSHDCPTTILHHIHGSRVIPTRTSQAMDIMINIHKPKYFFFAHHHISWRKNIDGCWFICLSELETLDISKQVIRVGNHKEIRSNYKRRIK